jgi:hypothetical protein
MRKAERLVGLTKLIRSHSEQWSHIVEQPVSRTELGVTRVQA